MIEGKKAKLMDAAQPIYGPWANYLKLPRGNGWGANTGVDKESLKSIARRATQVPPGFNIHKTVGRMMDNRLRQVTEEKGIDWGCGREWGWPSGHS